VVKFTWWIRARVLAAGILSILAVHQEWRPTKITPGPGYGWQIALPLLAGAIAAWLSLTNVLGRRFVWIAIAVVTAFTGFVLAVDAIPDRLNAEWSRALGPVGLAIVAVLAISARWWPRAFRAIDRRAPDDADPIEPN
jgi:hypothetical protein